MVVRRCSETLVNQQISPQHTSRLFAAVHVGWCTTGVNKPRCTPAHLYSLLRMLWSDRVCRTRAKRRRGLCPELPMQDPASGFRRMILPRTRVNDGSTREEGCSYAERGPHPELTSKAFTKSSYPSALSPRCIPKAKRERRCRSLSNRKALLSPIRESRGLRSRRRRRYSGRYPGEDTHSSPGN